MRLTSNQSEAIEKLKKYKVGALFMDAGTGKSRVALELVNSIDDIDLVLWVAPLKTISSGNIQAEIAKWGGFNAEVAYYGIESIQASDRIYLEALDLVQSRENVFVVCDESIKIKNHEAKRTKRLLEIAKYSNYRLILNGTPISRDLLDLWSQMQFLSPKILDMDLSQFKNTFCEYKIVTKRFGGRRQYEREFITGYENVEYLYSLIGDYVYECDLSLRIKQRYKEVRYRIDDKSMEEYQRLKKKYLNEEMLFWKNNNIFLEMTQKMQHSYSCTEAKFEAVDKILENEKEDEVIIFCKYVASREECQKRYPNIKVLSYQKDSLGLNLQQYRTTIYFDKTWDYNLKTQSERRTYRTGQTFDCMYYELTGNVGLEKLIDKNIKKKINMTDYFRQATKKDLEEVL